MTSNLGIDWYTAGNNYTLYKKSQYASSANSGTNTQAANNYNTTATNSVLLNQTQTDVFSLSHTSGCTDGADDGKIGLASAAENIVKGVGKTVVNAVKNMAGFNSDGSWSPLKLAKTVAIGALCTAFPAAGLVLAVGGIGAGAYQVVKGVGNAMNATTDSEAKSAWQNVGAGAFTTAASVVGAKASYKGVVKSAGNGKLADFADAHGVEDAGNLGSMLKAAKGNKLEFAKALGEDMVSSTKNNWNKITGYVKNSTEASQLSKAEKNMNDAKKALDEAQKPDAKTSPEKLKKLQENYDNAKKDYDTRNAKASSDVKELKETRAEKQATREQAKADSKSAKELEKLERQAESAKKQAADAKAAGKDTAKLDQAATEAQAKYDDALSKATDQAKVIKEGSQLAKTSSFNPIELAKSIKSYNLSDLPPFISSKYTEILSALQNSKYNTVVEQFGYENVLEALEVFGSIQILNTSI